MTAQIYNMRDYKTRQEREMEIERIGLAVVGEALAGSMPDVHSTAESNMHNFPDWEAGTGRFEASVILTRSDSGDCA